MPAFSQTSLDRLATTHPDLQRLFKEVAKTCNCTILAGHRNQADQDAAFKAGNSTKRWPNSNHNKLPSDAVDAAPFPIDWSDLNRFRYFAGYVMGVAAAMGIKLRSGLDWDSDFDLKDTSFVDAPHFERIP